jgi:sugar phosphate isomerase/epimerase
VYKRQDIYDPDGEIPFPNGYELIKSYMVHMHLKDAIRNKDNEPIGVPIGMGQVDYISQFKEIKKSGYDGYIVLETHYRPNHQIDEDLLALPKGATFSHMGYEATKECLINWDRLLNKI